VVHAPAQNRAWLGEVGHGASRIDPDGSRHSIRCSSLNELGAATMVASRSHRSASLLKAKSLMGVSRWLELGSAGLKAAAVATGEADAYIAPRRAGKRWDACAPDAIVTAAGGCFTDQIGEPIDYRGASLSNERGFIATNGFLHDAVVERLASIMANRGDAPRQQ
jgi:3'(2'), 5'-bisphosphate nucleotidase